MLQTSFRLKVLYCVAFHIVISPMPPYLATVSQTVKQCAAKYCPRYADVFLHSR